MALDLVIKNGTVVDGSGMARYTEHLQVKQGAPAILAAQQARF